MTTPNLTPQERDVQVLQKCREWIDEALSYVGSSAWSPSMEDEGKRLIGSIDFSMSRRAAALSSATPAGEGLTDEQIEDCIDAANRKYNNYCSSGPRGQTITTRDDWKHWLAREVIAALAASPVPLSDTGVVTQIIANVRDKDSCGPCVIDKADTGAAPRDVRSCTCHPDDRPAVCQKKYAASECQKASQSAPQEASDKVVADFENAVNWCTHYHTEYTGKVMPDAVYEKFARLRDETIPRLRAELLTRLSAPQEAAEVKRRAIDLHEKASMPWVDAEELALKEAGIGDDEIDELIGECGYAGLESLLTDADELRQFTRSVLVHQPLSAPQEAGKVEAVATLHDDGCFTWRKDEYRRQYDRQHAGWRMDVYAHPSPQASSDAKDAARYRWLRIADAQQMRTIAGSYGAELDDEIDAAILAAAGGSEK